MKTAEQKFIERAEKIGLKFKDLTGDEHRLWECAIATIKEQENDPIAFAEWLQQNEGVVFFSIIDKLYSIEDNANDGRLITHKELYDIFLSSKIKAI